jgi:hypothetical protein
MRAVGRIVFVACGLVGFGIGCLRGDGSNSGAPSTVEVQSALTARSAVCTLTLPFGTDASRFVVGANGALTLTDRVQTISPIENMGSAGTSVGNDAKVEDIYSVSKISLHDRTTVTGSVFTTTALSTTALSKLLGTVNTHAVLTPAVTQSLPANFPASGDVDILLEPGQTASPAPGRYRNAQVKSRAQLNLRSGTYFFETFSVLEPQALINLDERQGPVIIFANQPITFRGIVQSNLGQPDWLIGVIGTGTVIVDASFQGTILAPLATIALGTGGLTQTGAFFGHDVTAQPGTILVMHPSSALTRCATVLGGKKVNDLTPLEQAVKLDPTSGAPFPASFLHGQDQCSNVITQQTAAPGADGLAQFKLVANPSCSTPMLFCDPTTGAVLSPQPTLAQINAAPPAGSTCKAQAAVDRCLCPVNPATLGAACNFSSDCPNGTVCATICDGPNCKVPRRCGTYEAGCDGLPALANCQDLVVCPDPGSVGTVTLADLTAALKPPTAPTPGSTPPAKQLPVDHFDSANTLLMVAQSGNACGLEPTRAELPVVDQGAQNGTSKGSTWGISFTPTLNQKTASHTVEPFGVVIPSFNADAGLSIVARIFGINVPLLVAKATTSVQICDAKANVEVTVGPFGDESPSLSFETGGPAQDLCTSGENLLERATTVLNWSEAQVLGVIKQYQTLGPDLNLCNAMAKEFPDLAPSLSCIGDPVGSAQKIITRLTTQYTTMATDAVNRATTYASALAGIDNVSQTGTTFFDKPLEVLGAEANFPVGPFVVTVGGSVSADFKVVGSPHLDLSSPPGGTATIGAGFTVTPSAHVSATALIGVGFVVVTVGVEGTVQLIGIDVPVTAQVQVLSKPAPDPRVPANDGYSFGPLSDVAGFGALKSQRYGWDSKWSLTGDVDIGNFLSGELDAFVRIEFFLFSKTFRKQITSWKGISPASFGIPPVINLFNLNGPLPFSGAAPAILTAPRFAYVNPQSNGPIVIAPAMTPPPPPPDAGIAPAVSPVVVQNLAGITDNPTFDFCQAQPL